MTQYPVLSSLVAVILSIQGISEWAEALVKNADPWASCPIGAALVLFAGAWNMHFFSLKKSLLGYSCFTMLCYFLLYSKMNQPHVYIYIHVCVCARACSIKIGFATQWTIALQAPLPTWFSRQEYWSGLPFPSPGDLPDPGIKLVSPISSTGQWILYHWATWEVHIYKNPLFFGFPFHLGHHRALRWVP